MARLVSCSILFLLLFCFSTPVKSQQPGLIDQLGNLNKNLSDLLKQLNVTESQMVALQDIYKQLTQSQTGFPSISANQTINMLQRVNLGPCGQDLQRILRNPTELKEYIDAAGKPGSAMLRGDRLWFGSVEQCRAILNARVCGSFLTLLVPELDLTIPGIVWSTCFPRSCTSDNVSAILPTLLSLVPALTNSKVYLFHHGSGCAEKPPYNTSGAICTLVLCAVLLLLCLIGTILDMIIQMYDTSEQSASQVVQTDNVELALVMSSTSKTSTTQEGNSSTANVTAVHTAAKFCEIFLCFSLVRNTKKIFSTNVPSTAITSINGVRVISIWWVVLGHTFLILLISPLVENKAQMSEDIKRLSIMPIINAYFAVDSFFFLSGLLVAYTVLRKMTKANGKFNWALFYVHRFWRLTPSYMFVILFSVHLKAYLSDSPTWYAVYKDKECPKYWWANLLYINNFHPTEFGEQCISWSWYLANDMQFFVITPLLLILAFRYGWRGLAASTGALLLCSSIVTATLYGYYELDPLVSLKLLQDTKEIKRMNKLHDKYVYSKPYCRIQPYLVGFILGYAIYVKYCGPKRRGWLIAVIGWSVAFAIAMTLVYAPHESIIPGNREWSMTENIFYGTFQRLLWGLVLAWVTYACHYGYGGLIQQFLSARFWIPLSRLTYSVYLIHIIVLSYMYMAVYGTIHYEIPSISYYFIAATVLSYAGGFILAVVIEFPSENLENLALKFLRERKKYAVNS